MILGLCDRFHILPGTAGGLDAGVLRLLAIEALARPPQGAGDG